MHYAFTLKNYSLLLKIELMKTIYLQFRLEMFYSTVHNNVKHAYSPYSFFL